MRPSRVAGVVCSILLACASIAIIPTIAFGQQPCGMPQVPPVSREQNVFTPEQAVMLGDVVMQQVARDFKLIRDPGVNEYIQRIADRMSRIAGVGKVQAELFDFPQVNAFTLPGGRVLVARKLVSFAKSEDEVAGVLAHEFGHIIKRDPERDMSAIWRAVMNVTSVGDRADIEDKYNRMLEDMRRSNKGMQSRDESEKEQQIADQIAIWLMARAGYQPQAYVDVFDRINELKADTGSWLSDLFGTTKPESKRLRVALKTAAQIPIECVGARQSNAAQFAEWQQSAVEVSRAVTAASLHGVTNERKLEPPLRSDLGHLKFSADGKWVIAQDDTTINLLTRDPLAFVFRINAPGAFAAQFAPDSSAVVFYDENYRVERWNLEAARREWVREVVFSKPCVETSLSSDGSFIGCVTADFDARLYEVSTGALLVEKKRFYTPDFQDLFLLVALIGNAGENIATLVQDLPFFQVRFSPDNRYFIAARGRGYLAYDLTNKTTVSLPGAIRDRIGFSFSFLGNDRIVGVKSDATQDSAIVTFPQGQVVKKIKLGLQAVIAPAHGDNYIILRGIRGYLVNLFSVKDDKIILGSSLPGLDVYDDTIVAERKDGELGVYPITARTTNNVVRLPTGLLGKLRAADISPDLALLAVSQTSRGGVWNVKDGQRRMIVRGFRGVHVADAQQAYADFPKDGKSQRAVVQLNAAARAVTALVGIAEPKPGGGAGSNVQAAGDLNVKATLWGSGLVQYGRFLAGWAEKAKDSDPPTFAVFEAATGKQLWARRMAKTGLLSVKGEAVHDTLMFRWGYGSDGAKQIVEVNPHLKANFENLHVKKDDVSLLELIDLSSGTTRGHLLAPLTAWTFRTGAPIAIGDTVVFPDNENRTLVYSLATSKQLGHAFGTPLDVRSNGSMVAVQNAPGEVTLYSLPKMEKVDSLTFPSEVVFARFNKDGSEMFVLTAEQKEYMLKVGTAPTKE